MLRILLSEINRRRGQQLPSPPQKEKGTEHPYEISQILPDGGTIGFVAPSFGCATSPYQETFEHAQKRFTELGYRLDLGPNCYESSGIGIGISNTPENARRS